MPSPRISARQPWASRADGIVRQERHEVGPSRQHRRVDPLGLRHLTHPGRDEGHGRVADLARGRRRRYERAAGPPRLPIATASRICRSGLAPAEALVDPAGLRQLLVVGGLALRDAEHGEIGQDLADRARRVPSRCVPATPPRPGPRPVVVGRRPRTSFRRVHASSGCWPLTGRSRSSAHACVDPVEPAELVELGWSSLSCTSSRYATSSAA